MCFTGSCPHENYFGECTLAANVPYPEDAPCQAEEDIFCRDDGVYPLDLEVEKAFKERCEKFARENPVGTKVVFWPECNWRDKTITFKNGKRTMIEGRPEVDEDYGAIVKVKGIDDPVPLDNITTDVVYTPSAYDPNFKHLW